MPVSRLHDPERRGFASDNYVGAHPERLAASPPPTGPPVAYGAATPIPHACRRRRRPLRPGRRVFRSSTAPARTWLGCNRVFYRGGARWSDVDRAHPHRRTPVRRNGSTGLKLLTVPTPDGKLTAELVAREAWGWGDEHRAQPLAVSSLRPPRLGTVYTPPRCAASRTCARRGMRCTWTARAMERGGAPRCAVSRVHHRRGRRRPASAARRTDFSAQRQWWCSTLTAPPA